MLAWLSTSLFAACVSLARAFADVLALVLAFVFAPSLLAVRLHFYMLAACVFTALPIARVIAEFSWHNNAMRGKAEPYKAIQSNAKQCKDLQCKALQCKSMLSYGVHCNMVQREAQQFKGEQCTAIATQRIAARYKAAQCIVNQCNTLRHLKQYGAVQRRCKLQQSKATQHNAMQSTENYMKLCKAVQNR